MKRVKLSVGYYYFYNFMTQQTFHTSPTFNFKLKVAQSNIPAGGQCSLNEFLRVLMNFYKKNR